MATIRKGESIRDYYKFDKLLGKGAYSVVKKGIHKGTGKEFAIKIINKQDMGEEEILTLQNEVDILCQMDHPNVVKLYEIFDEHEKMYLVLELMTGGELLDRILVKEQYSEKEAADTIRPLIDAIRYCHSLGIVHRDIKPENLLYETTEGTSVIKISDFGLARFLINEKAMTACGTPSYIAPEILIGKGYKKEVDFWSIGVILYLLLCGFPPFLEMTNAALFESIKNGEFDFPSPYWDDISDLAKDLIKGLLVVDPSKRMTATEILNHPWIVGELTPRRILPSATDRMRQYNIKRKLKRSSATAIEEKFSLSLNGRAG